MKKVNLMIVILIVFNIVFFFLMIFISVYLVFYEEWLENVFYYMIVCLILFWVVVNFFMYFNNILNFLFYCVSGGNFRKEIRYFCRCYLVVYIEVIRVIIFF